MSETIKKSLPKNVDISEKSSHFLNIKKRSEEDDEYKYNVFFTACSNGYINLVKYFIDSGICVNKRNDKGLTPLIYAAKNNSSIQVIKELISAGADLNVVGENGLRPLMYALKYNSSLEVIGTFISSGANVNATDKDGLTPLMYSVKNNSNVQVIKELISSGANINATDKDGLTPLMYAVKNNSNVQVIKELISSGANINATDKDGMTPLIYAKRNNSNIQVIKELISFGENVNATDKDGMTILMKAIEAKFSLKIIQTLIANGGDIYLKNKDKKNAIDMGLISDDKDINAFFEQILYEYKRKKYLDIITRKTKKKFTEQQLKAIFDEHDAALVIAGAGCGKTTTTLGKIAYLVESEKAKINEILPIYFNSSNRVELNAKIKAMYSYTNDENDTEGTKGIAHTYHSLGLKILRILSKSIKVDEYALRNFIRNFRKTASDAQLLNIFFFVSHYMYQEKIVPDKINEKIEEFEEQYLTLNGEYVKSIPEVQIANYLFEHKIKYKYEEAFEKYYPGIKYPIKPDFYIPAGEGHGDVWIEHWGIYKDNIGKEKSFFGNEYLKNKKWKLEVYAENNADVIELFYSDFWNHCLIEKLEDALHLRNISTANIMSNEEKILCIRERLLEKKLLHFEDLVKRFIGLFKSNMHYHDFYEFKQMELPFEEIEYKDKRKRAFLDIAEDMYFGYEDFLRKNCVIDFTDMLKKAIPLLEEKKIVLPYKYILIDEFQDIDELNYTFIDLIRKQTNAKMFCVGDDWQSIYRFKGSNILYFTNFGDFFPGYKEYKIEQTFRNAPPLIDIAAEFVQKNPIQKKKKITNKTQVQDSFLALALYNPFLKKNDKTSNDEYEIFLRYLRKIDEHVSKFTSEFKNNDDEKADVLILYRNNNHLNRLLKYKNKIYNEKTTERKLLSQIKNDLNNSYKTDPEKDLFLENDLGEYDILNETTIKLDRIRLRCTSVHRSKGLESDYVFVFGLNNSFTGFPNTLEDDEILKPLLPEKEEYPDAEERRLFYVALTRAKKGCYLIIPKFQESYFCDEIKSKINLKYESDSALLYTCPRCGSSMIKRQNQDFFQCTNNDCKLKKRKIFFVQNFPEDAEAIKISALTPPYELDSIKQFAKEKSKQEIYVLYDKSKKDYLYRKAIEYGFEPIFYNFFKDK